MFRVIFYPLILLLFGCSSTIERVNNDKPHTIPSAWNMSGKLSVNGAKGYQSAEYLIAFNHKDFQLKLTSAIAMSQWLIDSKNQQLSINQKTVDANLEQWMQHQMGWYFPIRELRKIVFNQEFNDPNWQLSILRYQQIKNQRYPKILKLEHKHQSIQIKLQIGQVNQLK